MLNGVRGSTVFGVVLGIALLVSLLNSLGNRGEGRRDVQNSDVRGEGGMVSETREVGEFSAISLAGVGDVTVSLGNGPGLVVRAPENVLGALKTRVEDDTLNIRVARRAKLPMRRSISYRVTTPSLERLVVSGAGDIHAEKVAGDDVALSLSGSGNLYVEEVQTDDLEVNLSGEGDMQLSGSATEQSISVSGVGNYRACRLESEDAEVTVSGVGDALVRVSESLDAAVSGVGSVRYQGSPEVAAEVSGVGSVAASGSCNQN